MDNPRSVALNCEDHVGIPDDLRCKRTDGKQWRCTAMSMPDKTVCEKHYIQAKKRAANSALRASMKKFKKSPMDDGQPYFEGKRDDEDLSLDDSELQDYHVSGSGMKLNDRIMSNQSDYSPETSPLKNMPQDPLDADNDVYTNAALCGSSPLYGVETSRKMLQKNVDNGTVSMSEDHSDASTDCSDDMDGLICHQCRSDKGSVMWCLKCDKRGYCGSCISTWYSDIPWEDIQRACPACRGSCTCKICSRGDNLIKARIREIPVLDKLQYLYCLQSSVLPIVKQIHWQQCAEVELEKKLRGDEVDLERMKLNADEQMCCDCCRVPIVDYHRHCPNCSYDLCLSCCQDLRNDPVDAIGDGMMDHHNFEKHQLGDTLKEQQGSSKHKLSLSMMFPGWRANNDGSVPCLPREHGGCGCPYLTLQRIFKMNWVAKLVKNLEEMVSRCKINDMSTSLETGTFNSRFLVCAYRKDSDDNFLYCPSARDVKSDGIDYSRKHWAKGEPILVKEVSDVSSSSNWDPMVIWREICENSDEKIEDACRMVKAIDCLDWSEVDIELGLFLKGYSEGRTHEDGRPQMLKLKDWPSPSASEEFLLYQRPDFINKVPFLEFIHSKWGLLNVGAKLPHYSLQNDVGPKIFISYGLNEELGRGDSVRNLHFNMRDMAYLLVHSSEVKLKGWQRANTDKMHKAHGDSEEQEFNGECKDMNDKNIPGCLYDKHDGRDSCRAKLDINSVEQIDESDCQPIDLENEYNERGTIFSDAHPGALWDVFRREDISKLAEYIKTHWNEFGNSTALLSSPVTCPLFDEALYLTRHHKEQLKEEFGVEPWSFHQYLGQAVFIPAGCPFQVRNLQSTVQLGFDFLSPESIGQAVKLSEEIRCLPNDHVAKLQMVEVGKISLYAASSAIKEVQKLVLDQKFGTELVFEDHNLTAMVLENLESMMKQRQVSCA